MAANLRYADVFLGDKRPVRLQLDPKADITIVTVGTLEKMDLPDSQRTVANMMTENPINIIGHRTQISAGGVTVDNVCVMCQLK